MIVNTPDVLEDGAISSVQSPELLENDDEFSTCVYKPHVDSNNTWFNMV